MRLNTNGSSCLCPQSPTRTGDTPLGPETPWIWEAVACEPVWVSGPPRPWRRFSRPPRARRREVRTPGGRVRRRSAPTGPRALGPGRDAPFSGPGAGCGDDWGRRDRPPLSAAEGAAGSLGAAVPPGNVRHSLPGKCPFCRVPGHPCWRTSSPRGCPRATGAGTLSGQATRPAPGSILRRERARGRQALAQCDEWAEPPTRLRSEGPGRCCCCQGPEPTGGRRGPPQPTSAGSHPWPRAAGTPEPSLQPGDRSPRHRTWTLWAPCVAASGLERRVRGAELGRRHCPGRNKRG